MKDITWKQILTNVLEAANIFFSIKLKSCIRHFLLRCVIYIPLSSYFFLSFLEVWG